jgi:hypothetical protein
LKKKLELEEMMRMTQVTPMGDEIELKSLKSNRYAINRESTRLVS